MNDSQLLRYSRQIMLPQIGYEGQQKLRDSRVMIIGLGGLGSPLALYLAAAGVGELILCDDDVVDLSNLQRQIVHDTSSIGKNKITSAAERVQHINPDCQVIPVSRRLSEKETITHLQSCQVVADASDNFATRFMLNRASIKTRTPLVSGAAIKMEGQISVFNLTTQSPCYQCLYHDDGNELDANCAENGVLAPIVGIIGSMQALEVIKILCDLGTPLDGRVLLFDGLWSQWREIQLTRDPKCPVCYSVK